MPNQLTDLTVEYVSLVDRAAVRDPQNPTQPQRLLVWKAETAPGGPTPTDPTGGTMTEAEMRAALAKAEQERDEAREATQKAEADATAAKADLAKAQEKPAPAADPAKPEPSTIDKSELTPEARAYIEKMESDQAERDARIAKAEKAAQEADTVAKAERDQRVTREFVTKAEAYRALVVKADEFGPVLKEAAEKLSKESFEAIETVLKAADEQIAKGELFKEHGRGGEPKSVAAGTELAQKAEEVRKADSSLTSYEAMQQAMRQNPELARAQVDASRA